MSDKGKREVRRVTVRGLGGLTLAGVAMGLAVGQAATAGAPAAGLRPAETLWLAAGTEGGEGGEDGKAHDRLLDEGGLRRPRTVARARNPGVSGPRRT